jgi:ATP-binding cassette subfamily F protein uup
MDRLVDHLFVFEGEGVVRDFPGNYSQYRETLKEPEQDDLPKKPQKDNAANQAPVKKKLSFNEQREFKLLEKEIRELEKERKEIYAKLENAVSPYDELQKLTERVGVITKLIDEKELRWLELSENTF